MVYRICEYCDKEKRCMLMRDRDVWLCSACAGEVYLGFAARDLDRKLAIKRGLIK